MCANSEGSGETAQMRSLTWAFAVRLCNKYYNLMRWLDLFNEAMAKWNLLVLFIILELTSFMSCNALSESLKGQVNQEY